jgi:iduronate 2-sulfatase
VDIYPTLVDVCGLPKVEGLAGVSLKPVLQDRNAKVNGVAISQYPRKAPEGSVMGYSIRNERWRLVLWRSLKDNRIVGTELYDEVNDGNETKNVAALPKHAGVVAELSKFLPPPIAPEPQGAPSESKKENKKGKKDGKAAAPRNPGGQPRNAA